MGAHTLRAMLDHKEVAGSPLAVRVMPSVPCLSASVLDESALLSAVAGQPCAALLSTRNAFGAPLRSGAAALTAAINVKGVLLFCGTFHQSSGWSAGAWRPGQ